MGIDPLLLPVPTTGTAAAEQAHVVRAVLSPVHMVAIEDVRPIGGTIIPRLHPHLRPNHFGGCFLPSSNRKVLPRFRENQSHKHADPCRGEDAKESASQQATHFAVPCVRVGHRLLRFSLTKGGEDQADADQDETAPKGDEDQTEPAIPATCEKHRFRGILRVDPTPCLFGSFEFLDPLGQFPILRFALEPRLQLVAGEQAAIDPVAEGKIDLERRGLRDPVNDVEALDLTWDPVPGPGLGTGPECKKPDRHKGRAEEGPCDSEQHTAAAPTSLDVLGESVQARHDGKLAQSPVNHRSNFQPWFSSHSTTLRRARARWLSSFFTSIPSSAKVP